MSRLTKYVPKIESMIPYRLKDEELSTKLDSIHKLGMLEDIEEELGIELEIIFSALKNGVYYFASDGQLIHDHFSWVNNYIGVGTPDKLSFSFLTYSTRQILLFENYGKTWSVNKKVLIKDELL